MKTFVHLAQKNESKKKLLKVVLGSILVLFVCYGFAIASTTISIADAQTHNQDINELQTEIAELEIEYFEIVNTLSLGEAEILGFSELSNVKYARVDQGRSVAYNL
jgi:flagellar basal body-associated protein FliL